MQIQPIKTDADYRAALSRVEKLMDAAPGSDEEGVLDALATLVEAYEAKHFPIPDAHPLEAIRFAMEQNGMTDEDLVPFIGNSHRVSEIMFKRKPLTISMIRKLHDGLKIPADVLIAEYETA